MMTEIGTPTSHSRIDFIAALLCTGDPVQRNAAPAGGVAPLPAARGGRRKVRPAPA